MHKHFFPDYGNYKHLQNLTIQGTYTASEVEWVFFRYIGDHIGNHFYHTEPYKASLNVVLSSVQSHRQYIYTSDQSQTILYTSNQSQSIEACLICTFGTITLVPLHQANQTKCSILSISKYFRYVLLDSGLISTTKHP